MIQPSLSWWRLKPHLQRPEKEVVALLRNLYALDVDGMISFASGSGSRSSAPSCRPCRFLLY